MAQEWIKARQTKFAAYASVYILVIIAVLAAINFLANRYTKSYDSTSNKQYSLSDQTIKVVKGLKGDVKVYYFDDATRFPQARDLMDRYAALSPKFKVDYIDPVKKPTQAKGAGYRRDVSILVDSGMRKEEAKTLSEEEVTGALIRSLKSGERNVCFVSGSGEHKIDDSERQGYSAVNQALERNNYKTKTINLLQSGAQPTGDAAAAATPPAAAPPPAGKMEVPKDCTVLVVAGPQHDYVQPETDAIKAYVEGGGHALIMLDPPLSMGRSETDEVATVVALLGTWSVTVNKDLAQ